MKSSEASLRQSQEESRKSPRTKPSPRRTWEMAGSFTTCKEHPPLLLSYEERAGTIVLGSAIQNHFASKEFCSHALFS